MAASFFFSYASVDRSKDPNQNIERFFHDLDSWVQRLGEDGGFFDKQGIEAGSNWLAELQDALRVSRVLVPMYSPRYFMSKYCLWEWQAVFDPYDRDLKRGNAPPSPILPARWLTAGLTIPQPYQTFQFPDENFPPRVEDLSQLMGSKKHKEGYNEFVRAFATRLVLMIREVGGPANRVAGVPPDPSDIVSSPAAGCVEAGAQFVRCLFVTGLQREIVPPRRFVDCYGQDTMRKDWRPCFPTQDRVISELIEEVAKREDRIVRYLSPGPNLLKEIQETERQNNVVIIVVDPWSLSITEWQQFVDAFDRTLLKNCGVLVIWNKEDPDTNLGLPLFSQVIRDRFDRHIRFTNTFFRESVMSVEEFQQALVEAFNKIRTNLISEGKAASIREGMTEAQPVVSI